MEGCGEGCVARGRNVRRGEWMSEEERQRERRGIEDEGVERE
jgi:hypothetical protein